MKRPWKLAPRPAPGPLFTRPPMERIHLIFQTIKAGRYPNRIKLASDIEVTTKTIQRDLDFMRDRMGMPIAFNEQKKGYEFTEPVENFPLLELSEGELISIFVAQKALMQYTGTPFEHPLRSSLEKLVSGLEGKITLSWNDLDSFISFRSFEIVPADLKTFQTLSEAVRKNAVVKFSYKKLNASTYARRTVEPYHLACIQNQWYCFGYDLKRQALRTFVLARMRHAVGTGQTFPKPSNFQLKDHLKDSFGVVSGKGNHHICIHFDSFAAQLVRERVWHHSQEIQELTHGEIEFRVTLSSLREIEPWVLSWGDHARVIRPETFVNKLKDRIANMARFYQKVS